MMNSKIFIGNIEHRRFHPVEHHLKYPIYMYGFDLDELPRIDQSFRLFGYNRIRPTSIHDADYLQAGPENIKQKIRNCFRDKGIHEPIDRVFTITSARYFNYVFNPVTFHYCFSKANDLVGIIAEVNNTYGERHLYILTDRLTAPDPFIARYTAEKQFHVSPFNNMEGNYHFFFSDIRDHLVITIQLHRDDKKVFEAELTASAHALTPLSHIKTLLRHPIVPHMSIPRIYREAFKLYVTKKLAFNDKPVPVSSMTIHKRFPGIFQRLCQVVLFSALQKITKGFLNVKLPDGKIKSFGKPEAASAALIRVLDYDFFPRLVLGGEIGLGESYVQGHWDTPDLQALFKLLIENREELSHGYFFLSFLTRSLERYQHRHRQNTITGSRKNITSHYDLGNDFYSLFLDHQMVYSCALFQSSRESLAQAQTNKLDLIIRKARITRHDHVLEIGCGWGSFAIRAVKKTGCRVTGITISKAQYDYAREKIRQEGLEDNITIELKDYRRIKGRFDKIVSIEMIEAVGRRFLGTFFKCCDQLLKPDGLMVLQAITIPDHQYRRYSKNRDWIQKHIFPGGHLPSLAALTNAMTKHSTFGIEHRESIGIHYARTLRNWRERFCDHSGRLPDLGFDKFFIRKWIYYFSICEAGFANRVLDNIQIVLNRPGNRHTGSLTG